MLGEFAFIGLLLVLSTVFAIVALGFAWLIRPKRPNTIKADTYECGMETVGETWVQFKAQYYIYALVFLVFDVELVFLYPWAVAFDFLPMFAVIEGVLFILLLVAGLLYAWRKGILEWA